MFKDELRDPKGAAIPSKIQLMGSRVHERDFMTKERKMEHPGAGKLHTAESPPSRMCIVSLSSQNTAINFYTPWGRLIINILLSS